MLKDPQNQENSHIPAAINNSHDENSPVLKLRKAESGQKTFAGRKEKLPDRD
jgi:hypothetical protein